MGEPILRASRLPIPTPKKPKRRPGRAVDRSIGHRTDLSAHRPRSQPIPSFPRPVGPVDPTTLARNAWEAVETTDATLDVDADTGTVETDGTRLREAF